jgi:periplasmic protein TonB
LRANADPAQYASDGTAFAVTGAVAAIFLLAAHDLLQIMAPAGAARDRAMELTVQAAPAETPPAPPVPRARTPERPKPKVVPLARRPVPADPVPVADEAAPLDAALVAAATPPAPPISGESHPDLDAQYAAQLRADIDRRTRPPDTLEYRLRHPAGEVRVRFVVLRSGESRDVTLLHSSGSRLLDAAALNIVAAGRYAPMPTKVFAGQARHTFVVTIEFRPPSVALRTTVTPGSITA